MFRQITRLRRRSLPRPFSFLFVALTCAHGTIQHHETFFEPAAMTGS